jgi:hypothetical protein
MSARIRVPLPSPVRDSGSGIFVKVVGAVIGGLLVILAFAALFTYPVMLAFGIVHSYFNRVPAFGLFATFAIVFAVRSVIQSSGGSTTTK